MDYEEALVMFVAAGIIVALMLWAWHGSHAK